MARDQEKVANLGFFDESEDEKERKDAPLDPLFSQSAVIEESKDQVMSETEEQRESYVVRRKISVSEALSN